MKEQLHESLLPTVGERKVESEEYTELRPRVSSVMDSETGSWHLHASNLGESSTGGEEKGDLGVLTSTGMHQTDLTYAYTVLAVLLFTFISNQWSRQSINYLCNFSDSTDDKDKDEYMNLDLDFNQEEYATLSSVIFSVVFATCSLMAGSASDRYRRDWMAIFGCAVWSAATAAQAFIGDYGLLCAARIIIAISQAFFNPIAYTLLADLFPKSKLGEANGIFTTGIYVGGGLASISIVIDHSIGWRMTMLVIGGIGGLATVLLLLLVKDPRETNKHIDDTDVNRTHEKQSKVGNVKITGDSVVHSNIEQLKHMVRAVGVVFSKRQAQYIYAASTIRFMAGFSILTWKAPFIFDKFDGKEDFFSFTNAVVVGVVGLLSTVVGGYLADLLANPPANSGRKPRARAWIPAIGSILTVPCWIFFIRASTIEMTMVALTFEYLFAECWFGPTLATLFTTVDPEVRGTAQGIFSVLTAVGNVAPLLIGSLAGGSAADYNLGDVMLFIIGGLYAISGIIFVKIAMVDDKNLERERLQKESHTLIYEDESVDGV